MATSGSRRTRAEGDSSGHITGNFNSHQKGLVSALICEEAFWAGDNQAGNVLKDMITDEEMLMEPKGIDAIRIEELHASRFRQQRRLGRARRSRRRTPVLRAGNQRRPSGRRSRILVQSTTRWRTAVWRAMVARPTRVAPPTMIPAGVGRADGRRQRRLGWRNRVDRIMSPAERFVVHVVQNLLQAGEGAAYAEYELPSGVCEPTSVIRRRRKPPSRSVCS